MMSKGHVHLYVLVALLCVCVVRSKNSLITPAPSLFITSRASSHPFNMEVDPISLDNEDKENATTTTAHNGNKVSSIETVQAAKHPTTITQTTIVTTTTGSGSGTTTVSGPEHAEGTPTVTGPGHAEGTPTGSGPGHAAGTTTVSGPRHTEGTTTGSGPRHTAGTTTGSGSGHTIGVVFLILILIIIAALAVLLYILWKKGRTYSFDLSQAGNDHGTPLRSMEHGGTFEHTNKELATLDFAQEEKPHETNLTANGCGGETDKPASLSEQQNVPEEDSFLSETSVTPPPKKVDFSLDLDLIAGDFEVVDLPNAETRDQQQNENNNNVRNSGNNSPDIFTEINLNEPQ